MPVFESRRKVQELGSSLAMTLPAFFVKMNEVEKGCEVKVIHGLKGFLVVCTENNSDQMNKKLTEIIKKLENEP